VGSLSKKTAISAIFQSKKKQIYHGHGKKPPLKTTPW
jgi:hypothetical protein